MLLALWVPGRATAATYSSASTTYSLIDSSAHTKVGHNTTPYKFTAGAGCGTAPPVLDDTITGAIPIGFNFVFGGTTYNSAYIQTNGRLQFGNTTCGSGTASSGNPQTYPYGLPNASMNGVMKIFGVDLDPTNLVDSPNYPSSTKKTPCASIASCYISVATLGTAPTRTFVVTWKNVPEWVAAGNTSGSFDLQILLNEDGTFIYQYGTISHGGTGTAQVGWQISTTDYQVLSFGASTEPAANTAIVFYIPAPTAAYGFEERAWGSGVPGQVTDSTSSSRNGTALGGAQAVDLGKVCRAASIPANTSAGTVDAVATGVSLSNSSLNMLGAGTAAFWYKASKAWNSGVAAQLLDATTVSGEWFYLARTAAGTLYFEVKDSTGVSRSVETAAQVFAADTWVHIAIAWDFNASPAANQDSLRIWINGAAPNIASFTSTGTPASSIGTIHLGDNPVGAAGTKGTVNSADGMIDEAQFYNSVLTTPQIVTMMAASRACTMRTVDHLELQHGTGTGLTCLPGVLTIRACANAACSTLYTGGLAGSVSVSAGTSVAFNDATGNAKGAGFVIPAGSSSVTKGFQITTAGSTLMGAGNVNINVTGTNTCTFGSPQCTMTTADTGFLVSVPNHQAEAATTASISAVVKATNSLACVPAFASVTKPVNLRCAYSNPGTGTLPVRVGGSALNASASTGAACDGAGRTINLTFDSTGKASSALQYADAGQVMLTAQYTGSAATKDTGLVMSGSGSFIAAPSSFAFSGITAAPIKAGNAFAATVTAKNSTGGTTPNFGNESAPESAALTFTRRSPTGAGASNGTFTGSLPAFSSGSAAGSNFVWTEVGTGDLSATLSSGSYLGSGMTATGTTGLAGAVGPFIPHHFDVTVTQACLSGAFTFAGQPAIVTVTARNGLTAPTTTVNYDGSVATSPNHAKAVTLSDALPLGLGTLSGQSIAASAFSAGVATGAPTYAFTNKLTGPQNLQVRAVDTNSVSSQGFAEGIVKLRSGRLRLSNAFGSASQTLAVPVISEYWTGASWLLNSGDSCTVLPAASVVASNARNFAGSASAATTTPLSSVAMASGSGLLNLAVPTPATAGVTFDLSLNLGSTLADQSCTASHPASTGASMPWLRSFNGSCAATADRDPSGKVSFGIYTPESKRTVHTRELF